MIRVSVVQRILMVVVIDVFAMSTTALAQEAAAPPAKPKIIEPKVTPTLLEKGKVAYAVNCVSCHGELGDGMGPVGALLNPKPRNFAVDPFKNGETPGQVFTSVTAGIPTTVMVPFGHLPEDDRWGLTYYVISFRPVKAPPPAKSKTDKTPKSEKRAKAPAEEKK